MIGLRKKDDFLPLGMPVSRVLGANRENVKNKKKNLILSFCIKTEKLDLSI